MTLLGAILDVRCTAIDVVSNSRKRALQWVSTRAAETHPELDAGDLYEALQARERLGSTGLRDGVAIPHCRIDCNEIIAVFVRLEDAIDFDAPDSQGVDLIFALIVPEEEERRHLTVLAQLSQVFSDPVNLDALRKAGTADELRDTLVSHAPQEG